MKDEVHYAYLTGAAWFDFNSSIIYHSTPTASKSLPDGGQEVYETQPMRVSTRSRLSLSTTLLNASFFSGSNFTNQSFYLMSTAISLIAAFEDIDGTLILADLFGDFYNRIDQRDTRAINLMTQFSFSEVHNSGIYGKAESLDNSDQNNLVCMYSYPSVTMNLWGISSSSSDDIDILASYGNMAMFCGGTEPYAVANYDYTDLGFNDSRIIGSKEGKPNMPKERLTYSQAVVISYTNFSQSNSAKQALPSNNTDIRLFPMSANRNGWMFSTTDNHLTLVAAELELVMDPQLITTSEIELSGIHFATALLNKTNDLYVYFRRNDTHLAELKFDTVNGFWSEPNLFST